MKDAARTGADIALLNYLSYGVGKGMEAAVTCRQDRGLLESLPAAVSVLMNFPVEQPGLLARTWKRVWREAPEKDPIDSGDRFILAAHKQFKPDIWYINTILQPEVLRLAKAQGIPCILHSHELEHMLLFCSEDDVKELLSIPALVIAGSSSAREVMLTLGRSRNVEVCYGTIDPARIKLNPERTKSIRESLGLSDKTYVWTMAGTLDPNKNPVRFVQIAAELLKDNRDVHFIWLGGYETGYSFYARELAKRLGVDGKVSWVGARSEDYYDYLNAADGFLLTSSKESFSIVSVEAAFLGKPIVAFDCGGLKEIVEEGMGVVVDSWNLSDLIRQMVSIMKQEILFDPRISRKKARDFFIDNQGELWLGIIQKYFPPEKNAIR